MKYKILLFLAVVCLCLVFSLNCFANSLDGDYSYNSGNAIGNTEYFTPSEMLTYINDYTVVFNGNGGTVINCVFYVSNYTNLFNKISQYVANGDNSISFTQYINFKLGYQSLGALTQGNTISNFNSFSIYLNDLGSFLFTNRKLITQIQNLTSRFNSLSNDYDSLLTNYNNLQTEYQSLLSSYDDLDTLYNGLLIDYNSLNSQYNQLQNEYDILLSTYNSTLYEIDELYERIENLNDQIDMLNAEISDMEYDYEILLNEYEILYDDYDVLLYEASDNYQEGFNDGMTEGGTMTNGLISIFGAPMYVFGEVFDFEILGINILSLIKFVLTVSIIGYVILKLRS